MRNSFFTNQPLLKEPLAAVSALLTAKIQVPGDQLTAALDQMATQGASFYGPLSSGSLPAYLASPRPQTDRAWSKLLPPWKCSTWPP